jgi:FMN phosphatase YigB (HAD superfamily)
VVNSLEKKRKKSVFLDIIQQNQIQSSELLCVGNSLTSEIYDALQINATACYFEFGEERGDLVSDLQQKPHYHIKQHAELIPTCQL